MTSNPPALRAQLLYGYAVILATVVIGYVLILGSVIVLGSTPTRIIDNYYNSIHAAERMIQAVQSQQNAVLRKFLSEDYNLTERLGFADQNFKESLEKARESATLAEEKKIIERIQQRYDELQTLIDDRERWASTHDWETDVADAFQNVITPCQSLATLNSEAMLDVSRNAHERVQSAVLVAAIAAAITLLVGLWTALSASRRLSKPLEQIVAGARQIAQGDYQVQVPQGPIREVAQLARQFNRMAEALQNFRAMDLERVLYEQQQSEAVLQSMDDGLVIIGHDACIQRLNPVAARQLGLDAEHCLGRRLGDLLADDTIDSEVQRCLGLHSETTDPVAHELQIDNDDGLRYLAYSVLPIIGNQNKRSGVVMVLRDITEHKAFEQMRTEFVMRASHELRTPVTSIRMGIGMLSEKSLFAADSREQELFNTVAEELNRLMRLVNDLFDLSRLQAGRLPLELEPCSSADLLEAVRQRFQLKLAEQNIELQLNITEPAPRVLIDPAHFDRVLDNLVSNAMRHIDSGDHISLGVRRRGDEVEIDVSDSGSGIDYAQQRRIFEPFVQVSESGGGAGLGLAICREIVQQHGGRITLKSAPGKGASFIIRLPV